ncbi:uncharacterized protein BDZ99DRAFT_575611 [Mytilinidion resinicola]|uniref:Uncharacterized protein n=1 Tax=Mytilinidion resinicola TaxID=574789 RepID=A0A6A6Y549_9PEZI|nr:uncharacterized protein BDZ99DRAFT_575611 [Mytilinidion resinicola]KAF2803936.1 hypothetical protein BDZ99DRAFT_575611 [Mytilinidion resinicola]
MADKLMDIEPGGENTQYESIKEFTKPHKKESGQLGDPTDTSTTQSTTDKSAPNSAGITPAAKIRYGQALQEGGMGGQTEGGLASNTSTSAGGAREAEDEKSGNGGARAAQGYGSGSGVGG